MLFGLHRGGTKTFPENTAFAFQEAGFRYPDAILETDATVTKDGHAVLLHDDTVDRTTNGTGRIQDLTLAEVRKLDAAYRFTRDGGKSFPLRGAGVTVPTLSEALKAAPRSRFLIDLKPGRGVPDAVAAAIRAENAEQRVLVASFVPAHIRRFRELMPQVPVAYDFETGAKLLSALRGPNWESYQPQASLVTMMKEQVPQFRVTPSEVAKIRAKGIRFQIHTLTSSAEVAEWSKVGVDGMLVDDPALLSPPPSYLPGHSHNDYWQKEPLTAALNARMKSIEVDVFLQDGELRVGHDLKELRPGRTLESMYLAPLARWFDGRASGGDPLLLLIDLKTDGAQTYSAMRPILERYRALLTAYERGKLVPGPVIAVLSGSRPVDVLKSEAERLAFIDGRLSDLEDPALDATLIPLVSESFTDHFEWMGRSELSLEQRVKLMDIVARVHRRGMMLRFWAAPDTELSWRTQRAFGIDLVNTNRLAAFSATFADR